MQSPPEDMRQIYAMLRAPKLMQAFCSDTLIEDANFHLPQPSQVGTDRDDSSSFGSVAVYTVETRFEEGTLLKKAEEILARVQAN